MVKAIKLLGQYFTWVVIDGQVTLLDTIVKDRYSEQIYLSRQ